MFRYVNHQGEDGPDVAADHHIQQYQNYYAMDNTLLDAESFAVRFLAYLRSLGSALIPRKKAILQFAYKGASSSSPGQFGVSPIPAGFFDYELPPNDPSRVRLRDIHPGSWVVLVDSSQQISDHIETVAETPIGPCDPPPPYSPPEYHADLMLTARSDPRQPSANIDRRSRSCGSSDDNCVFLHYSFVKIHPTSAETAPEQHQQRPVPVPNRAVVGGITSFLRETAPGSDVSSWEKQVEEVERDFRTRRASIKTGKRRIDIGVMAESRAWALLNQLL